MKKIIYVIGLVLLSSVVLSSCSDNDSDDKKVVNNVQENVQNKVEEEKNETKKESMNEKTEAEKSVLTDDKWMTLYIFKKDTENVSKCSGECEVKWPVFYNENLKENGYSSIKREDWKMQTTLNGQPLYYFFKDEKAWDMKGEGLKNVWYTIKK